MTQLCGSKEPVDVDGFARICNREPNHRGVHSDGRYQWPREIHEPRSGNGLDRDVETREFALGARKFAEWWEPEFGPVIASVSTGGGSSVYLTTAAVRSLAEVAAETLGDAAEPYQVGEEVTGARAVACPVGTTLRCTHAAVVAFHGVNGWRTTVAPRVEPDKYHVGANPWRILELPEGES